MTVDRLSPARPGERRGTGEARIMDGDLDDEQTLVAGRYVPIWSIESTRGTHYAAGVGPRDKNFAFGYGDLDLEAGGGGTGSAGDDIDGDLRWAIYPDTNLEDPLFVSGEVRLGRLREAMTEDFSDKVLFPMLGPIAGNDRVLALEVKVVDANDGNQVGASQSDANEGIPYSKVTP